MECFRSAKLRSLADLNKFILYNSVTTISLNGNLRAVCTNLGHLYAYFERGMAIFMLLQQNTKFSAMKFTVARQL